MPAMILVVQIDPAPMPTFTASTPEADERLGRLAGGDVAGNQVDVGERTPHVLDDVEHTLRVAVRGVDHEHVHVCGDERGGAVERILGDADRGADAQSTEFVLAGAGILHRLLDVLDGDEALQAVVAVHHQQLLDLVAVQDVVRLVQGRADRNGDEVLLRHDVGDRPLDIASRSAGPGW